MSGSERADEMIEITLRQGTDAAVRYLMTLPMAEGTEALEAIRARLPWHLRLLTRLVDWWYR